MTALLMMTLTTLAGVKFKFCHCKVTPSLPFIYSTIWKEVVMCIPHLGSKELYSIFVKAEYLQKLFGILHGKFASYLRVCMRVCVCGRHFLHRANHCAGVWLRQSQNQIADCRNGAFAVQPDVLIV